MKPLQSTSLLFAAALMVSAGCSSIERHAGLEQARVNLAKVRDDPQISANAPVAIHEAAQTLGQAEKAWEDGNRAEVNHLVSLTEKKIEIARQTAQGKIAESEAQRLATEREKVVLEARTQEAERAKQEAQKSAREAEQARRQAEQARLQQQATAGRVQELEIQLREFHARQTERGLELTLSGVLFEFDKAILKPGALRGLEPLVAFLKEQSDRKIVLEGHTDSVGSDDYNLKLSQQRAEAVRDFLLHSGIDARQIAARGMGKAYPLASNDSEAGRLQNRRVQIIISNEPTRTAERQ